MRRAKQAKAAKQATRRVTCLLASEACNEQQAMRAMRVKCEASEASTGAHKSCARQYVWCLTRDVRRVGLSVPYES